MQGQLSIFWIGGAGMSTAVASTLVGGGGGKGPAPPENVTIYSFLNCRNVLTFNAQSGR